MWAHHDGSELYLSNPNPMLESEVTVTVRVATGSGVDGVAVRTVEDGEPRFFDAERLASRDGEDWYTATIRVRNPIQNYRFLLTGPGVYVWLNGTGLHSRDVPDAHDFKVTVYDPAPTWARESVLYQIFPDRFARTGVSDTQDLPDWAVPTDWDETPSVHAPETSVEFYGGDLPGITAHLDYLGDLGVTGIYLTPIFAGRSNHRYDASTFTEVDPLLGGDEALAELSAAAHARGMHLLGDLTTNHTGDRHEWFLAARADSECTEHGFYYFTDFGYESWLGVDSLPKLNYHSAPLWDRFLRGPDSIVGRWLRAPYSLDGWRIDVANMTGRRGADDFAHEVARAVRATVVAENPDALVIGEHFHDATGDVNGDGWHANMNYTGFTRPLWTWLADPDTTLAFLNAPTTIPSLPGSSAVATIDDFLAKFSWQVRQSQWNMLGSHDTPRIRTVVGSAERHVVAAAALFTLPGTPVIFAGDELSAEGINGEHSRTTIPWGAEYDTNPAVRTAYQALIRIRASTRALTHGGLRWLLAEDDAIAFVRDTDSERVLVVLTRGPWHGHVHLPGSAVAPGDLDPDFTAGDVTASLAADHVSDGAACPPGTAIDVTTAGPGVWIMRVAN